LEFDLFSVAFALVFNIEYRFGRYLNSLACYLYFKLFAVSTDFRRVKPLASATVSTIWALVRVPDLGMV
jgi:hypothetical protein